MSLTLKTGDNDFEKLAVGIYHSTCFRMVDLGTQDTEYNGEKSKKKQIRLDFEITEAVDPDNNEVNMEDGRPFGVSRTYTASLFESAALRKELEAWRGKSFTEEELDGFDISKLIGCTARVEIGLTQKTQQFAGGNPKILNLQRPDGGVKKVATINPQVAFDMSVYCDEFNGNSSAETKAMCDVFHNLTPFVQETIEKSYEYRAVADKDGTPASTEEEIVVEEESNGLADFKTEDKPKEDKSEEDIPF